MSPHPPSTTAFLFVGGVSHTPVFFDAVNEELNKRGYESEAIPYPTIGDHTENMTLEDEYQAIRDAVEKKADAGKDVVLVSHSYGGWPASRAANGYDIESRKKAGKKHGVIELVFFSAFLIPDNGDMKKWSWLPPWVALRGGEEYGERNIGEMAIDSIFSDLSPEDKRKWHGELGWHRNAFHGETIPGAPWHIKTLPKTYIMLTEDQGMTLPMQLDMMKGIIDETWAIKSLASGHEAMISHPKELAEVLLAPRY